MNFAVRTRFAPLLCLEKEKTGLYLLDKVRYDKNSELEGEKRWNICGLQA